MSALPYSLDRWYPAACGRLEDPALLGDPLSAVAAERAWAAARPGEGVVLCGASAGAVGRAVRAGRRGAVARIAAGLRGAARVDRWHVLPGPGGTHVLVPAGSPARFRAALPLLPAGRARTRLLRAALGGVARAGLADRLGLDEVAVAFKGPAPPPLVPWMRRADRRVGAVALGVPGLFRKAIVQVARPTGEVEALLKLSLTRFARARVKRESHALRRLAALGLGDLAPAARGAGLAGRCAWLAQEALDGRRSPDELGTRHFELLKALYRRTLETVPLSRVEGFRRASDQLDDLRGRVDDERTSALAELRLALGEAFADRDVRCAMAHGDLTPWNVLDVSGRLRAVDWESAEDVAPALWDLFHFHVQTGVLVRRVCAEVLLAELDELLAGPARPLVVGAGIDRSELDGLLALYVFGATVADEHAHAIETPPFPQVGWLREARLALAHLLRRRLVAARTPRRRCPQ